MRNADTATAACRPVVFATLKLTAAPATPRRWLRNSQSAVCRRRALEMQKKKRITLVSRMTS